MENVHLAIQAASLGIPQSKKDWVAWTRLGMNGPTFARMALPHRSADYPVHLAEVISNHDHLSQQSSRVFGPGNVDPKLAWWWNPDELEVCATRVEGWIPVGGQAVLAQSAQRAYNESCPA